MARKADNDVSNDDFGKERTNIPMLPYSLANGKLICMGIIPIS